ncbi:MAG: FAD-dependent oxidoreductase [Planctomycetaceae bacterium]
MTRLAMFLLLLAVAAPLPAADLLVEAEGFDEPGGWKLDTQFIQQMGSPYLLAHGLGKVVDDATTTVEFPEAGTYRVFVRTFDWVERWKAKGDPGQFHIAVDGNQLEPTFGTAGANWGWHDGGSVEIADPAKVTIAIKDLTGFDGRCDAIYFTTETSFTPPNTGEELSNWRKDALGLPRETEVAGPYDLVVIGGGYSGMGAAISAARMGCKVALIQNRPVLGGNGSSEIRVWAQGLIRRGKYPRIGEIIDEFADKATASPGLPEEFGDELKEKIVRAEQNIDLFLSHHADAVHMKDGKIDAVEAFDVRTSRRLRFEGRLFADCTGHGTIGYLAEADWDMTPEGRMGMSNMWRWEDAESPQSFPETPWALDLTMKDFPYPKRNHAEWFWESGFDQDPIKDAEAIRDWNLRAAYGAFNAMKNRDGAAGHKNAELVWLAYIGGPRESRRLLGDVILTQEDIVAKREFPDGCVPSTWSIDLHYPKEEYADKFAENPFISIAVHDRRVDRKYGYPIPYRCFYSRNIPNLFMAGRNISVTHEALGTTRVMKTCGMMGEVVGKAASLCVEHDCLPRDVHNSYLNDLLALLELPGKARRTTIGGETVIPDDALPLAGPHGVPTGIDPAKLKGVVVDDDDATHTGTWTTGEGLKGYVGYGYRYAGAGTDATITFTAKAPAEGTYEVRYSVQPHENRASNAVAVVKTGDREKSIPLDLSKAAPIDGNWSSLGRFPLKTDAALTVTLSAKSANGFVHADALWLVPVK